MCPVSTFFSFDRKRISRTDKNFRKALPSEKMVMERGETKGGHDEKSKGGRNPKTRVKWGPHT